MQNYESFYSPNAFVVGIHLNDFVWFPTSLIVESFKNKLDLKFREKSRALDYSLYAIEKIYSRRKNLQTILENFNDESRDKVQKFLDVLAAKTTDGTRIVVMLLISHICFCSTRPTVAERVPPA